MNHMYTSNDDILTRQTKYYEFHITKKKIIFFQKKKSFFLKKMVIILKKKISLWILYKPNIYLFIYFPSNTPNGNANDFLYASYRESSL